MDVLCCRSACCFANLIVPLGGEGSVVLCYVFVDNLPSSPFFFFFPF